MRCRGILLFGFAIAALLQPVQARGHAFCALLTDLAVLEGQVLAYAHSPPEGAEHAVVAGRILDRIAALEAQAASRQIAAHLPPAASRVLRDHLFSRHSMIWLVANHSPFATPDIIMRIRALRPWQNIVALQLGAECDPDLPPGMTASRPAVQDTLTQGVLAVERSAEADPSPRAPRPIAAEAAGERQGGGAQPGGGGRSGGPYQEVLRGVMLFLAVAILALALVVYRWLQRRHRRRAARFGCHLQTHVELGGATHPAVILDISRLGCKLATSAAPPSGARLSLALGSQQVRGSVAWSNSHYVGVVFDKVLRRGQLARLLVRG